jgi:hypothetical protein
MSSVGVMAAAVNIAAAGTDVLMEPFNNFTFAPWANTGCTIVAGRNGTAARLPNSSAPANKLVYSISVPNATVTVGFAFRTTHVVIAVEPILYFRLSGTTELTLAYRSDGSVYASCAGSSGGSAATGLVVADTWVYIEMQFFSSAAADGWVKVRVNGVERLNLAGVITRGGAGAPNQLALEGNTSGITQNYDDLYLTLGAGAPFKGDITIP